MAGQGFIWLSGPTNLDTDMLLARLLTPFTLTYF